MDKVLDELNMKLRALNKHRDLTNLYRKQTTDQERITFTFDVMIEYDIVPKAIDMPKSATKAEKLREQGNKVFTANNINGTDCIEALKLYTKSAAYAPYPSKELALAYANRSAVLFKIRKYVECIQDIDRALMLDYPDNLRAKLYIRKMECLATLGGPLDQELYDNALYWLKKMSLNNNCKKLKIKLDKVQEESKKLKSKSSKQQHEVSLPVIKTQNPEVPCASDSVAVKYNEHFGRHIVATRKLHPGEVIAVERPYSLILKPEKVHTHCSNCLKVCWANIPCDYCTYAMYCSENCKVAEWKKYHDVECPIFSGLLDKEFLTLDLLSIRLALQAIREFNNLQELKDELKTVEECAGTYRNY